VAARDEERLDVTVGLQERFHIDDQVLDERLARQPVPAVDAHGVRAADAVRARAAERQRAVLLPLDRVQRKVTSSRRW
jgi:hypothetical protein